jgi:pimeloyl-ACP methyl ester carboxylesterase
MRRVLLAILVLVVVAGGFVYVLFARDLSAARNRIAGHSQTIATRYGTLEYAIRGDGEPVLAIHGTGGGFDQGLDMGGPLADAGYRLIAPSRFGYLASDFPADLTTAMQADAFADLLDALGVDRTFIFGGSAGALSAMQFAIRYPDRCRALVVLVPAAYAPDRAPNTSGAEGPVLQAVVKAMLGSDFIFWSMLRLMPETMTRMLLATDPRLVAAAEPAEQERVHGILWNILPVSIRAQGLIFDGQTAGNPEPYPIEKIACPVLAVSLKDDMFGTAAAADYIAATVPDGRAVIYPTGGHVWVGRQADVWAEIVRFLKAVPANE